MYKKLSEESKSNSIKNMSDNLVALRTMLHLTQAQLAEIMGVTRQTLVLYETGKRVMTWNTFLSLMFIFTQKRETRELLNILNIYTDEMKDLYGNDNKWGKTKMNVSVVLLKNDRLYYASADRGSEISFGSGKKDIVQVADFTTSQIAVKINFDSFYIIY